MEYLISDDPVFLMDIWETRGTKGYLWSTPENEWFRDPAFERVGSLGEVQAALALDYDVFQGQHGNPQQEAEDAVHNTGT